jgi:hypothetical protein
MKHIKKFKFFEGNRFDKRTKYQTTNQEWLDWEEKVENIKERLIELSKEIDDDLIKVEETCKNIKEHLFDIGEISHMGLLGDHVRSIENSPLFQMSKEKSDSSYEDWKKNQELLNRKKAKELKAREKEWAKKYPDLYGWRQFLDEEDDTEQEIDKEIKKDTKLEKSVPNWFNVIERAKNKINYFRNWMTWEAFMRDPISNSLPKDTSNIISNLEMLESTLEEMPDKFSKLLRNNLPDISGKVKEIEKLRKEYYELLEVQPIHWVTLPSS